MASSPSARPRRCWRATASRCACEAAQPERAASAPQKKAQSRPQNKPRTALRNEVRIIGGLWRGRKLPVADRPGLRPTPDRVRETLFNWLGQDLSGWRVLDAFAGSGALGFEAASRGAAEVLLLEADVPLLAALEAARTRLQAGAVRVERADAIAWMRRAAPQRFELVLLDPPFESDLAASALAAALPLVVPQGWIYLESAAPLSEVPAGAALYRTLRAGAVHAHLLRLH
jgi:16S rRNA (guanine966-N2)-methyltransferase